MRYIILILLSSIPVWIAIWFKASDQVFMLAAAPLLIISFVIRMNRAKSLHASPTARLTIIGIVSTLAVVGGLMWLVLWFALMPKS